VRNVKNNINSFALAALILAMNFPANAQQPGKVMRVGYLDGSTPAGAALLLEALGQELSKLGWVEGKNVAIEYRFGENKGPDRLAELAAQLVHTKLDLIVVSGTQEALAAKSAATDIPIVMTSVGDPVGRGLVVSLARPGSNLTGFVSLAPELNTKRLEILKDALPKLDRVGVLRPSETDTSPQMKGIRAAAPTLKLKLVEIETQIDTKGLERAFRTAKQKQVGAIIMHSNPRFFGERKRVVELAGAFRLPAIYYQKEFVDEGGLMSYGTDYIDLYRRSATYVDKILRGAKPADLPVQQATKFEFIINLKAAKQIGLTIPNRVLERANQVIR